MANKFVNATFSDTPGEASMPMLEGTMGPAAVDIQSLYARHGLLAYDPGFRSTASCKSAITFVDGDNGVLLYRGYPIEELAEHSTFIEVAYLLMHGELPDAGQREAFQGLIYHHNLLHEQVLSFYRGFRRDAHPMAVMVGVVGALSAFYHDVMDIRNPQDRMRAAIRLIAKMPDGGNWLTDRFSAGMRIRVMGVTDNANEAGTFYTIDSATGDTLTLTSEADLTDETDVNVTIAPEITKIIVIEREDVDGSATEDIVIDADTSVYLGSGKYQNAEYDLNLNSVKAGTTIRIKGDKAIYNSAGLSATNIEGEDLILEAAGGPIGGPGASDKLYTDLAPSATITARAQDDIYIVERDGNMNVETMFSEMGGVYLEAQNSIVDGLDHDFTKIAANHVELTAISGAIGEGGDYLEVDVGGSGTLIAHAEGSIWIRETLGDMNVEHVESYGGDVDLRAHLFILDPLGSLLPEIIGNNSTLITGIGGLGLSANPLEIDSGQRRFHLTSCRPTTTGRSSGPSVDSQAALGDGIAVICPRCSPSRLAPGGGWPLRTCMTTGASLGAESVSSHVYAHRT